ncbi:MAG: MaoC family dehydratase N-terminal domain-containing protein [Pseudomonadota bacterium]|nr:MaoC family dehydratase N-terminal domain-containing protein [Pseudomonadota bacterium]
MATGGTVADLDKGDVLGPVEYRLSSFVIREYTHTVELHHPVFQDTPEPIMPPTLVHLDKLRLYRHACPGGTGPSARIHFEYDVEVFAPARAGDLLRVTGHVEDRYVRKGREYVVMRIDMERAETGELLLRYLDRVILSYEPRKEAAVSR